MVVWEGKVRSRTMLGPLDGDARDPRGRQRPSVSVVVGSPGVEERGERRLLDWGRTVEGPLTPHIQVQVDYVKPPPLVWDAIVVRPGNLCSDSVLPEAHEECHGLHEPDPIQGH